MKLSNNILFLGLVLGLSIGNCYGQLDWGKSYVFHFRFDKSVLDSAYMNNASTIHNLNVYLADSAIWNNLDSIIISAAASPEGVAEHNALLARCRAATLKAYILWKHPAISAEKIAVRYTAENWDNLKCLIEKDPNVPYRDKALAIIGQSVNSGTKEWRLKQLGAGATWNYFEKHFCRYLRTGAADVEITLKKIVAEPPVQPEVTERQVSSSTAAKVPTFDTQKTAAEHPNDSLITSTSIIEPVLSDPANTANIPITYTAKQLFAIKTNLLELLGGVANIGAEIRLSEKYTLDVPLAYSPYTISSDYRLRMLKLQPEGRYWLREAFRGHFVGVHLIGGIYNLSVCSDTRYQSNRMAFGAGVAYGYALRLKGNWNLEFSIGAGYLNTGYDCYHNVSNGTLFDSRTKHYWGITKASVGVIYLINRKSR